MRPIAAQTGPKSLPAITSQAQFDTLSITYDANTPYALPHVLFVIDRKDGNRIYYVNKKRYSFHKDFVNGTYLSLERGNEFFDKQLHEAQPALHSRHARVSSPHQTLDV